MRKFAFILFIALSSAIMSAQTPGVIKFMGIPVDGKQSTFASKLRAKGFNYNVFTKGYEGEFNGTGVDVFLHTTHKRVDMVQVNFPDMKEKGVKSEFNSLLVQYRNTGRYYDFFNQPIPDNEDISAGLSYRNKKYEAAFYYFDNDRTLSASKGALISMFEAILPREEIAALKEDRGDNVLTLSDIGPATDTEKFKAALQSSVLILSDVMGPEEAQCFVEDFKWRLRSLADGVVRVTIDGKWSDFHIVLYYENFHNQPHGEDL